MKSCPKCAGRFDDAAGFCPRDGEVLVKDHAGLVGRTLDNQYEIERFIAAGGMGAVYRARHILLGDPVAIKILTPEMSGNAEWLKRFQREGQVARKFRHPNAVLVHDLRTSSDGLIYMVMEYVEGRTLDALLRERGRFSPEEALTVLEPIASVLDAAHAMGVVHRDLKPENVMLGNTGVKLLDLGIAKMREIAEGGGATSLTVAGQILGTPYYMSPEQWGEVPSDGNPEIDGRADIYSLGVMFYELVSGHKPFGGQTLAELRRGHVSFAARPLHEVAPGVPPAFGEVIARSIAKDRRDRQPTAGKLVEEMRAALGLAASPGVTHAAGFSLPTQSPLSLPGGSGSNTNASAPAAHAGTQAPGAGLTGAGQSAPTVIGDEGVAAEARKSSTPETSALPASALTSANAGQLRHAPPLPTMATPVSGVNVEAPAGQPSSPAAGRLPGASSPGQVTAQPARRSSTPLLAAGLLGLLLLAALGAGGWYIWSRQGVKKNGSSASEQQAQRDNGAKEKNGLSVAPTVVAEKRAAPVLNWWVEVAPQQGPDTRTTRQADRDVGVSSREKFRFHFTPQTAGYLYIIGPGAENAPTTFLTDKPVAASGVKTNRVEPGKDFVLSWMTLGAGPGPETYSVLFSPAPLTSPAFLTSAALRQLSSEEQGEWAALLSRYKANPPDVAVKSDGEGGPAVVIHGQPASAEGEKGAPVAFEINVGRK